MVQVRQSYASTHYYSKECALAREICHHAISLHDRVGIGRRQVINVDYFQFGTAKYYEYYYFVCSDQEVEICSCEVYIPKYHGHPLFDCLQYKNWRVRRCRIETSYIVKYLFCA